ncbi:homoserine O-acetyltransferase [Apiospora arundinis]
MSSILPQHWALSPGPFSNTQPPTDSGVGPTSSKRRGGDVPPKLSASGFACPYYKSNPSKYIDCLSYTSASLSKNIKQHLERCHKGPEHYCPTCGLIFATEAEANDHIVSRQCETRDFSYPGMNKDQWNRICEIIKVRGGKKSSIDKDKDKWYEIWAVLFPGQARPESPTRGSVEHEMAVNMQAYMQTPRYHALRDYHYPEYQEDVYAQDRILCFVSGILTDHANHAEEERGKAEPQQPDCVPPQLIMEEWFDDRNE